MNERHQPDQPKPRGQITPKPEPGTVSPFATEAVLGPGLDRINPALAAKDAEDFLAYGHNLDGFDLADPEVRAWLDLPPDRFTRFMVHPKTVPAEIAEQLTLLPPDWEENPDWHPVAIAATDFADGFFKLPPHLATTLFPGKELWICLR